MDKHNKDYERYEELLYGTRNDEGIANASEAVRLLADELSSDAERMSEFATSRAMYVQQGFDKQRTPQVEQMQLQLKEDSWLVLGERERVRVDDAKAQNTRDYLIELDKNFARQALAHGVKNRDLHALIEIQDEHECTLWQAYQIWRNKGK
jgi:hypothetical protein